MLKNKELMYSNVFIILITANLIFSIGCQKISNAQWVYYDETYCSNPWKKNSNSPESEKITALEDYYNNKNVKIFKMEITSDGNQEACLSCGCKSGNRVKCKVKEKDVSIMSDDGFYQ